jgi:hypothetical protein
VKRATPRAIRQAGWAFEQVAREDSPAQRMWLAENGLEWSAPFRSNAAGVPSTARHLMSEVRTPGTVAIASGMAGPDLPKKPYVAAGPGENAWDCRCGARRISYRHYPDVCPSCGSAVGRREPPRPPSHPNCRCVVSSDPCRILSKP